MDHSHMDHSHMDHSDMGHGDMCSMNMLFTWDTRNLCIVFRQWHIRSTFGLVLSLIAIVAIGAGYEALRAATRRYEVAVTRRVASAPNRDNVTETTPFLWLGQHQTEISRPTHLVKATLYAAQNFYAFMLMLIFMTYNGWVMIAVSLGAFVGYLLFGATATATKENACH